MAIFKYKKPNGSGGYSIAEMPVISNTYTEYVVQDATDGTRTITLTPTKTSDSTGPGAFEDVIANVKLLSSNPTYDPMTSLQTITYGSDGFPAEITISAIPTTTETYTSSGSKQEYNFNTSTGFPTKVTINAMPVSTPPADLQITTPSETITIPAGYYSSSNTVSIHADEQAKIIPENIKLGITLLGVEGTCNSYDSTNRLIGLIDKSIIQLDLPFGITKVGDYVFYNCTSLTNISIPDSTNSVDSFAFQGCTSLQEVVFHGTPNSIASSAFSGDTNITDIYVPWASGEIANAPWGATNATIHYNALEICYGQRIDESNTYWYISDNNILYITGTGAIPSSASGSSSPWYSYKDSINKIIIGNKITSTPNTLFQYHAATEAIIGTAVTNLNARPFAYTNITTLNIPASVSDINGPPALGSLLLTSYTVDSNNQNYSASNGILYNKNKTSLIAYPANKTGSNYTVLSTVTNIGAYAFDSNPYLTTLHFNNANTFSSFVCEDCSKLTTIYFRVTPTTISSNTLRGCSALRDIYVPWASGVVSGAPWGATSATIHYNSTVY